MLSQLMVFSETRKYSEEVLETAAKLSHCAIVGLAFPLSSGEIVPVSWTRWVGAHADAHVDGSHEEIHSTHIPTDNDIQQDKLGQAKESSLIHSEGRCSLRPNIARGGRGPRDLGRLVGGELHSIVLRCARRMRAARIAGPVEVLGAAGGGGGSHGHQLDIIGPRACAGWHLGQERPEEDEEEDSRSPRGLNLKPSSGLVAGGGECAEVSASRSMRVMEPHATEPLFEAGKEMEEKGNQWYSR